MAWLRAFAVTQLVEAPLYARALTGRPIAARALLALGASALTHPVLWFVLPHAISPRTDYLLYVAVGESYAVLVEAAYLATLEVRRALLWALGVNGASVLVGYLLYWLDWL